MAFQLQFKSRPFSIRSPLTTSNFASRRCAGTTCAPWPWRREP